MLKETLGCRRVTGRNGTSRLLDITSWHDAPRPAWPAGARRYEVSRQSLNADDYAQSPIDSLSVLSCCMCGWEDQDNIPDKRAYSMASNQVNKTGALMKLFCETK